VYGLVNYASVLAAEPGRGTILSSRVDQSKGLASDSVPIKLIFFQQISIFVGQRRFIFNFAIVEHAKTADFLGTR